MKTVDDPEYFPPVSIFGFQVGPRRYQFAGEETFNNSLLNVPANVDSTASMQLRSQHLQQYLEQQCLEGEMSLSMKELMTHNSQMLRLGPFNAAYNQVQMNNHSNRTRRRLLAIRITVKLEDVHCQATSATLDSTGVVLVSGILKGQVSIYQSSSSGLAEESGAHWTFISVEQKPLAVEGTWNPVSGELHMVGCSPMNFHSSSSTPDEDSTNKTSSGSRCDWKFCMNSVLRDSVTMDSPEGAVLSSLHEDDHQHPNYFEPLRFTRLRGTAEGTYSLIGFDVMFFFNAYRYTRISRALALAKKNSLNAGKRGLERARGGNMRLIIYNLISFIMLNYDLYFLSHFFFSQ
jgi:hypothetical protein